MTLSGRTTESDSGNDSQQQALTTTLTGAGYLWRPWFATVGLRLNLSLVDSESQQAGAESDQGTAEQLIAGDARLNLFPRSRFPLTTFLDIYDSRVETDRVGIPLADIDTLRRERVGVNQQYRTVGSDSSYGLDYVHTSTEEQDDSRERIHDVRLTGAHQLGSQAVQYGLELRDTQRDELGLRRTDRLDSVSVRHSYRPSAGFTLDNVVDVIQNREELDDLSARHDVSSAADSSLTWRPANSPWTVRTRVGLQKLESEVGTVGLLRETAHASSGVTYEFSRSLRLSGDMGFNRTRAEGSPDFVQHFQNATLAYTPSPVPLGAVNYHWSASGTLGNTDTNDEESVQLVNLNVRHGVDRIIGNGTGPTITLSAGQAATQFLDSENFRLFTLEHRGSAAVSWSGVDTSSQLQGNLSDSRSIGQEPDSSENERIDQVSQTADVVGSHRIGLGRYSSVEGDANVGVTRVEDSGVQSQFFFTNVGAGYTSQHTFAVDRLRFRSRLEFAVYESRQDGVAADGEQRMSWDSRLDYTVGLLGLAARRTLTEIDGSRTTTNTLSVSRSF